MKRIVKFADDIRETKIYTEKSIKRHTDNSSKQAMHKLSSLQIGLPTLKGARQLPTQMCPIPQVTQSSQKTHKPNYNQYSETAVKVITGPSHIT